MRSNTYRSIELLILFVLIPIALVFEYVFWLKGVMLIAAFGYLIYVLLKVEKTPTRINLKGVWPSFWRHILPRFAIIAVITTIYVAIIEATALFYVPINDPLLFVFILAVYSLLSVWPQELVYRTFFFKRYEHLFQNKTLFLWVNATLFSLAHLFFRNTLVLVLTFLGGLLFGITYLKFRSTTLVSIEHALYGNWLFTVGMGQMLAFPGME